MNQNFTLLCGDALTVLKTLPDASVHCCVTSPPYWGLRDYGVDGQLGLESSPDEYVTKMVEVFREVRRVLHDSGTCWINCGDSYFGGNRGGNPEESEYRKQATNAGSLIDAPDWGEINVGLKPKDLCLIPWRFAIALQQDGWWVRSIICWAKKSCMPESVTDRPTNSWEPIFLLTKSASYYFDAEAVKEPAEQAGKVHAISVNSNFRTAKNPNGSTPIQRDEWNGSAATRNQRNVWTLGPEPQGNFRVESYVESDANDGDSERITSPDCPVHGDRRASTSVCGERAKDLLHRTSRTDGRPVQEQELSPCPIPHPSLVESELFLAGDHAANDHNNASSKTPHGIPTSPSCNASVQKRGRTGRKAKSLVSLSPSLDTPESNTSEDCGQDGQGAQTICDKSDTDTDVVPVSVLNESGCCEPQHKPLSKSERAQDGLSVQIASDIHGKCSCSYRKAIYKEVAHFASFVSEIPRRAILAGTSARGCCPKCGEPWVRVVEKEGQTPRQKLNERGASQYANGQPKAAQGIDYAGGHGSNTRETRTIGWKAGCECKKYDEGAAAQLCAPTYIPLGPVPCTVLDPFGGSGTTGMVALELGRKAVLVELNPEYVRLIQQRCDVTPGLQLA